MTFDMQRTLRDYLRVLFRRKWLFVVPFVAALVIAAVVFVNKEKQYRAEALVLREDPVLLRREGQALAGAAVAESLEVAATRIRQPKPLISILCGPKYGIHFDQRVGITGGEDDPRWERVLPQVQRNISIRMRAQQRNGAIQYIAISYTSSDRHLAKQICEAITNEYVEGGKSTIADQLSKTIDALKRQLVALRAERLEPRQNDLRTFETDHLRNWPKEAPALAAEFDRRQAGLQDLKDRISLAGREIDLLKAQLEKTPKTVVIETAHGRNPRVEEIDQDIRRYENQLTQYRLKFTDEYPAIKELQGLIENLKRERAALPAEILEGRREGPNPLWVQTDQQLVLRTQQLEALKDELEARETGMREFQERAGRVLDNFRRYTDLRMEVAKLQAEERRLEDQIERNVNELGTQDREEGIRFQVLEQPRLPHAPASPDPMTFLLMGVLAGAAGGVGLVVLAEHADHSLRSVSETARVLNVSVIGTIGVVRSARRQRLRRALRVVRWTLLGAFLVAAVGGGLYLWRHHEAAIRRFFQYPRETIHEWTDRSAKG